MDRRRFAKQLGLAAAATFSGMWPMPCVSAVAVAESDESHRVALILKRLAGAGWKQLFAEHGLDISVPNLGTELLRPLNHISRQLPGFEDFYPKGKRAIEPGVPAASLLLHAFASPNVVGTKKVPLTDYPTLGEIEAVENLVFAAGAPTWEQLQTSVEQAELAVAVFAVEYRPASKTPHGKYADLCFSRTGVARVGTHNAFYDRSARCFTPFVDDAPNGLRVLPSRFSAYVAAKMPGSSPNFSVLDPLAAAPGEPGDSHRSFWVPVHKLFSGRECIAGEDLRVTFRCAHTNEKLHRVHVTLKALGADTGWSELQVTQPPFQFTSGIAEVENDRAVGPGVVAPVPHDSLIERAIFQSKLVTVPLVAKITDDFKLHLSLNGNPENTLLVDATLLEKDGEVVDVSFVERERITKMRESGFRAVQLLDYTGQGSVGVTVEGWARALRSLPAASLVNPPDLLPFIDPNDLTRWTSKLPVPYVTQVWEYPPIPLSDKRALSPTTVKEFEATEETLTAVRSGAGHMSAVSAAAIPMTRGRSSFLPDAASGLFDAGWDWGNQSGSGRHFFSNQWSSSPFAVDMGICGAQNFWPGTVPDLARWFAPFKTNSRSITDTPTFSIAPLTDDELGLTAGTAWDKGLAPSIISRNGTEYVQYLPSYRASYAQLIEKGKFDFLRFARLDRSAFLDRVLAMARVYRCLDLGFSPRSYRRKTEVALLSFRVVAVDDSELQFALTSTKVTLSGPCFRFEICSWGPNDGFEAGDLPGTVAKKIFNRSTFFVEANVADMSSLPRPLLQKPSGTGWVVRHG